MTTAPTPADLSARAHEIYDARVRARVEPERNGEFLALDILSEDYELGSDEESAFDRLRQRRPDGLFFLLRVGFPTSGYIGASQ